MHGQCFLRWWEEQSRHSPFWQTPPLLSQHRRLGGDVFFGTVIRQGFSDGLENEQAGYPPGELEYSWKTKGVWRRARIHRRSFQRRKKIQWIKRLVQPRHAFVCEKMEILMCLLSARPQNIESRLKVLLPDDVGAALMDGVVLCHLANHICPRSVASIHVPSPAVVSTLMVLFLS